MALEILAPYRAQIDSVDDQIVALLERRYAIVKEVAGLKAARGIASVLPDRVAEVTGRVRALAAARGLDPDFVAALYGLMIDHAHAIEDRAKQMKAERPDGR